MAEKAYREVPPAMREPGVQRALLSTNRDRRKCGRDHGHRGDGVDADRFHDFQYGDALSHGASPLTESEGGGKVYDFPHHDSGDLSIPQTAQ
jgi:hypothetical protein